VDGVVLPFKTVAYCGDTGITIARLKDVKFDVEIPDSIFRPQVKIVKLRFLSSLLFLGGIYFAWPWFVHRRLFVGQKFPLGG